MLAVSCSLILTILWPPLWERAAVTAVKWIVVSPLMKIFYTYNFFLKWRPRLLSMWHCSIWVLLTFLSVLSLHSLKVFQGPLQWARILTDPSGQYTLFPMSSVLVAASMAHLPCVHRAAFSLSLLTQGKIFCLERHHTDMLLLLFVVVVQLPVTSNSLWSWTVCQASCPSPYYSLPKYMSIESIGAI